MHNVLIQAAVWLRFAWFVSVISNILDILSAPSESRVGFAQRAAKPIFNSWPGN